MVDEETVPARHLMSEIERKEAEFLQGRDPGDETPEVPRQCPPLQTVRDLRQTS